MVLSSIYLAGADNVESTHQAQLSSLRTNGHIVIDNRPYKVVDISIINGQTKIVGVDIFTEEKHEAVFSGDPIVDIPKVTSREYTVIEISEDNIMTLLHEATGICEGLIVPEDKLGDRIREVYEKGVGQVVVTIMSALGEDAVIAVKVQ